MIIENRTDWDTADLKKFFLAGLRHKAAKLKKITVTQDRRKDTCDGYAHLGEREVNIILPKAFCGHGGCLTEVAQVFEHECDHAYYGFDHHQMEKQWWELKVLWSEGMSIGRKKQKARQRVKKTA